MPISENDSSSAAFPQGQGKKIGGDSAGEVEREVSRRGLKGESWKLIPEQYQQYVEGIVQKNFPFAVTRGTFNEDAIDEYRDAMAKDWLANKAAFEKMSRAMGGIEITANTPLSVLNASNIFILSSNASFLTLTPGAYGDGEQSQAFSGQSGRRDNESAPTGKGATVDYIKIPLRMKESGEPDDMIGKQGGFITSGVPFGDRVYVDFPSRKSHLHLTPPVVAFYIDKDHRGGLTTEAVQKKFREEMGEATTVITQRILREDPTTGGN